MKKTSSEVREVFIPIVLGDLLTAYTGSVVGRLNGVPVGDVEIEIALLPF